MRILFPSETLDPKAVDPAFAAEKAAAQRAGLETSLIDSDALGEGAFDRAVRRIPAFDEPQLAIYRGWMLTATEYRSLHDCLAGRGVTLINTPDQYRHTHHLPESYPVIRNHTPRTVWTTTGAAFDLAAVMALLAPFGDAPIVVKDYVKSQKHDWHEACFIPSASDPDAVRPIVTRFIALQSDALTGGLVFREFIELERLTTHSKSGMPLTEEFRVFFLDARPLFAVPYWEEGDNGTDLPPADLFLDIAARVGSRFFTTDVARRTDGRWIVIELGDAQVSGLPDRLSPAAFYACLDTTTFDATR